MRRTFSIALLCFLWIPTMASAASPPLQFTSGDAGGRLPAIEVVREDADGVTLDFALPALAVDEFVVDGQAFQVVGIPEGGEIGEPGRPMLPTFTRLVAVPDRAGVTVSASVIEEETIPGFRLMPAQAEDQETFAYDPASYGLDAFTAGPAASSGSPAILRDVRIIPITFQPVQFNPARGEIKVARKVRVEVAFQGEDLTNARVSRRETIPPTFHRLYQELVVNYRGLDEGLNVAPGALVIIAPNDAGVLSRLQPLVDWHQRKGTPTTLVTTAETGTSTTSIKNWLQNAYDTWPEPIEFVAFAGDANGTYAIPTYTESLSGYNGEGDHPYAQLEGGDILADVHLGRLSFRTYTELEVIVAKSVGYESTPFTASDPNWFRRACLVGDPNSSGYSTIFIQQWVKERLRDLNYAEIDTVWSNFVSGMTTALNKGDTIFCYRGYLGMSNWTNSNTYAMQNGMKLPFAIISTCGTGSFEDDTEARSEAFLRAHVGGAPRGGIGAMGTATLGTHTRYNNCITHGVMRGLLWEEMYAMGAAITRGKVEMYLNYNMVQPNQVAIWSHWNNLMGDPAVEIFTGYPEEMTVTHPTSLAVGANAVTVTVSKEGGPPIADALVCLWKGTETYAVAYTDSQGMIELPVSTPTAGNMKLTVTKHDRYPYLATIVVSDAAHFVGYQASTSDDDASGESSGNGDGAANPGETIELRVQLKNFGSFAETGVTATLTSDDPYVTIGDASESFGNIAAGATAWSVDDFNITIDRGCPHGRLIRLGLDVQAGVNVWHSLIDLPIVSAEFSTEGYTLYNAGGNGLFDPGETIQVSVKLRNNGGMNAASVACAMTSLGSFVTVTDGSGAFGTINAGSAAENTSDRFGISASPETYQGYLASFQIVATFSGGTRDTTIVSIPVGTRSSDDPIGPDLHGYMAFDNTDTSYPDAPSYQWIEIDPSYGGSGTQIPLTDNGTYQDDTEIVNLPFPFMFYGDTYTKISVCSNGWLAMGWTYLVNYRNWTIPGAGGPPAMVAGFWDDLNLGGGGKVLYQYDAANHRFIVEWSRVRNEPGNQQTFEIILYDPAHHPTSTGDGIIEMQYHTVNNTDSGDNYCTAGIENYLHTDGLLYSFQNQYPNGAAALAAGRAVRYIPMSESPSGTLAGTVTNASYGGVGIPGAEVVLLQSGRTFITGSDGNYGGSAASGSYTVVARHASFMPDTAYAVVINQGQATDLDFSLTDILGPEIADVSNPVTTTDTAGPYPISATITDFSAVSTAKLYYRLNGAGWIEMPMASTGDTYTADLPGSPAGIQIDYYVWAQDVGGKSSTSPADAPDGFYSLYITEIAYQYAVEDPEDPAWQLGAAGDGATSGLWVRVDPNGTEYNSVAMQPEDDQTPAPGTLCFVTGQGSVGGAAGDQDVDGGCTTLVSPEYDLSGATLAFLRYARWYGEGGNSNDDEFAVDVSSDGGQSWTALERVPDIDNTWREMAFDLAPYINLTGQVQIRFVACDLNTPGLVEAAIDDISIEVFVPAPADVSEGGAVPARTALSQNRPNPFNPVTRIRFDLAEATRARVAIYDAAGRSVRVLVDGDFAPGSYQTIWDGRDDAGRPAGSGIYFYKLETGGYSESRRLTILR